MFKLILESNCLLALQSALQQQARVDILIIHALIDFYNNII